MKLYVKTWCPWCVAAREWLDAHAYKYELVDVEANRMDYDEMIRFSGQGKTPTLLMPDGKMLPDFGTDELVVFLGKHGITP